MHYAFSHCYILHIKRRAASVASSEVIVGPADGVLRHGRSAFPAYPLFRINCVSSPPLYIHYNFSSPLFLSCFLASPAIIFIFFPRFSSLPYYVHLLPPSSFVFYASSHLLFSSSFPSPPPPYYIHLLPPLLLLVVFAFVPLSSSLSYSSSLPSSPPCFCNRRHRHRHGLSSSFHQHHHQCRRSRITSRATSTPSSAY